MSDERQATFSGMSQCDGSVDYSICFNQQCRAPSHNCSVAVICKEFITIANVKPNTAANLKKGAMDEQNEL